MQNNRSRSQIITSENGYKNLGTPNNHYNRDNTSNMNQARKVYENGSFGGGGNSDRYSETSSQDNSGF